MTVGEMLAVAPVRKKPCRECPFRKRSAPGYLGGFSAEETIMAADSDVDFVCHMTRGTNKATYRSCAGRLLYAAKTCKVFRNKDLERAKQKLLESQDDACNLENILDFDFIQHHKNGALYEVTRDDNRSE